MHDGADGPSSKIAARALRLSPRQSPLAAALWMAGSCAALALLAVIARYLAKSGADPFQIVFFRLSLAAAFILPFLLFQGARVTTDHFRLYIFRSAVGLSAMLTWFWALAYLPVPQVMAITFLTPVLASIGAAIFLHEIVNARRWAAIAVGFFGALIILRPGTIEFGTGTFLALISACAMGCTMLMIKNLTTRDRPDTIVFISAVIMAPAALLFALPGWQWPTAALWPFLLMLGPIAAAGHMMLTRAMAAADASFVQSFDFIRLPFGAAFGFLFLGEVTDIWTWIGAAVIFCASLMVARHERERSRAILPPDAGR